MAATLRYFMLPDDERAVFRHLARRELTAYPELIPPGYQPVPVDEDAVEALDQPAYYLAVERLGPVIVHPLKRGPDKGMLVIEEVPSPVFHYERSVRNDAGELVAGRLWAELDVTDDPNDRKGKPLALKGIFEEVHQLFRKSWRRSDPKGYWVGPHAAAALKRGELKLREAGHKGGLVGVWR
ncbi:hypothetical protein [Anaeromyxobacter dehalogenans]|uniref:Uncharacterized protein n=1 Tax=Anaeromyxobacter dehalogenans (strain 2CP-C) TaxID=290397 RepID=Q2IL42_ANADE|nr:hypothetical protein [Anaeromyxobacter dehalogenans]ABC82371.1 hypothetical protein Adeh_2601 [Anaeromyxobacter dehalogenans 2CP-C]